MDRDSDIVFLTETWLQSDKNSVTAEAKTYGYKLLHDTRKNREKDIGGGVGILIKSTIPAKQLPVRHFNSFEHTIVKISLAQQKVLYLICIYRVLFVPTASFIEEVSELFDRYVVPNEELVIAGDFNIHMETESVYAKEFKDLLHLYDLRLHIDEPTHVKGHTLDLVVTPNKESYIRDLIVTKIDLSHHFLIDFSLIADKNSNKIKMISYRNFRDVDMVKFNSDVNERLNALPRTDNLMDKVTNYNTALEEIVNECSPIKTNKIRIVEKV